MLHPEGPELAPFDPVTKAELLELLSSCKGATSTGLDGVSYDVLKHILHYDEKDLLPAWFNRILAGGEGILKEWKEGKITLLPKISKPLKPSQLRPICLTSTVCKLFGKLLSVRLRKTLPEITVAQLGARKARAKKTPVLAVKLDIAAAFDSVHHRSIGHFLLQSQPSRGTPTRSYARYVRNFSAGLWHGVCEVLKRVGIVCGVLSYRELSRPHMLLFC